MVATFEDADELAAGVGGGDLLDNAGQLGEVFGFELQGTDGVLAMGVEAGAEEHKLRIYFFSELDELVFEMGKIVFAGGAVLDGQIPCVAESWATAGFVLVASARIERPAVD